MTNQENTHGEIVQDSRDRRSLALRPSKCRHMSGTWQALGGQLVAGQLSRSLF